MCHVSSFLAIWLVGVLFVCSRYVGSEDWWGDMEVILTCHSTVKGVQRKLPKRLGNLDIVHCYFTGWWFQILLVKRNRSFASLKLTCFLKFTPDQKQGWHGTHVVLYPFQPACMVIYFDLLFLGWYWWLPTSCFIRTFQATCLFHTSWCFMFGCLTCLKKADPQRGPKRKRT